MKKIIIMALIVPIAINAQKDSLKKKEIKIQEVTLVKRKKAVEHLADRTIYDFSEQSILNSGSMLEGLKKIPGILASESVDIMYQGKTLDVYMDGRPLKINGNSLISFLEGLPANSVDRIEIITNPGAEYAATSGNAIINIISSKKSPNYTTLTYFGNYSFSNYDNYRNKLNNGIFIASKIKNLNWKLNFGQSYKESLLSSEIADIISMSNDKYLRYNYFRPSLTFNFNKSRLIFDYDLSINNDDNNINDNSDIVKTKNKIIRNDFVTTFQKVYDDRQKKFETKFVYSSFNNDFSQNNLFTQNSSNQKNYSFSIDYSSPFNFLEKSKLNMGGKYDNETMSINHNNISSLDFARNTFSSYVELQSKFDKFDIIVGVRGENYDNIGKAGQSEILFNKFKLFPNASIQYNIMNSVFISTNYNKKIKLPSINLLNPNNTIFQNPTLTYSGNPYLEPSIYDNYSLKFSAFDYATLSYDVSFVKNDIFYRIEKNSNSVNYYYQNAPDLTIQTVSLGLPLPLMLFSKGFNELMKFNYDINKIDILYFYADYQKYKSEVIGNQKGIWSLFVSGQFILPKDINFQAIYKVTFPGTYKYFLVEKPFQNTFDLNISKKFLKDRLNVAIYGNDIFNSNQTKVRSLPLVNGISLFQKTDSRSFGLSLNYKIINSKKTDKSENFKSNDNKENEKDILNLKN